MFQTQTPATPTASVVTEATTPGNEVLLHLARTSHYLTSHFAVSKNISGSYHLTQFCCQYTYHK